MYDVRREVTARERGPGLVHIGGTAFAITTVGMRLSQIGEIVTRNML